MPDDRLHAMRDIADALIESADGISLGRVADIEVALDGAELPRLTAVLVGPEALAGRLSSRLRPLVHRLLRGRFEHRIDLEEIATFGPTLRLRHPAGHYRLGHAEYWIYQHLLRFIPGSGRR